MFFVKEHFMRSFAESDADFIAKEVNNLLKQNSRCLFGNLYQSGDLRNFSAEQKESDTHALLAVQIRELGMIPVHSESIHVNSASDSERIRVMDTRIKQLEKLKE